MECGAMYEEYFLERLTKLRGIKKISAREMSLSIGQNRNYINQIENKKAFPTLQVFFYICEYLQVTPKEFFDEDVEYPIELNELIEDLKKLDATSLATVSSVVKEILRKK